MNIYKNTEFTKRNNEITNIVACRAENAPSSIYSLSDESILGSLKHLYTQAGVQYYGYL